MANSGTTTPPISPQQIVHNPKVPPTLPKPIRQLPPPASVQKLAPTRDKPSNIAAMTAAAANAERYRQLKPVDLDNIFAYKPSNVSSNNNERNLEQQKQNQAVLEVSTQQRNQQCRQQPQQQAQQTQQELEWVVSSGL
jgi:hypothetical protein